MLHEEQEWRRFLVNTTWIIKRMIEAFDENLTYFEHWQTSTYRIELFCLVTFDTTQENKDMIGIFPSWLFFKAIWNWIGSRATRYLFLVTGWSKLLLEHSLWTFALAAHLLSSTEANLNQNCLYAIDFFLYLSKTCSTLTSPVASCSGILLAQTHFLLATG